MTRDHVQALAAELELAVAGEDEDKTAQVVMDLVIGAALNLAAIAEALGARVDDGK
jgi:hypothetical protein